MCLVPRELPLSPAGVAWRGRRSSPGSGKELLSGAGICVASPFSKAPGHPCVQLERGPLPLGVVHDLTCLCVVPPVLGFLSSLASLPRFPFSRLSPGVRAVLGENERGESALCYLVWTGTATSWCSRNLLPRRSHHSPRGTWNQLFGLREGKPVLGACWLHTLSSVRGVLTHTLLLPSPHPRQRTQVNSSSPPYQEMER